MQFDPTRRVSPVDALALLPGANNARFASVFRHGSLELEIYAPIGDDPQTPHTRDEAYIVISGHGMFVCDADRTLFQAGDFLFAPAGVVHRFEDFSADLAVWVLFYGPQGGERSET